MPDESVRHVLAAPKIISDIESGYPRSKYSDLDYWHEFAQRTDPWTCLVDRSPSEVAASMRSSVSFAATQAFASRFVRSTADAR
ncbi:hypothetical protein [Azonexus sp.]|uniref:hypothetical protein n=1 Tax=Azonexus sp. TaxID=1872668 RepID=UPI0039E61CF6